MDHPVITGRSGNRHRRTGNLRTVIDWPHMACEQAATPLRLVNRRNAGLRKPLDDAGICTFDILTDDAHRQAPCLFTGGVPCV